MNRDEYDYDCVQYLPEHDGPHATDYTSMADEYVALIFDDCLNNSAFEHLINEHDLDDAQAEELGYYIEDWDPRPIAREYRAMINAITQAEQLLRGLTASTITDDNLDQLRAILSDPGDK